MKHNLHSSCASQFNFTRQKEVLIFHVVLLFTKFKAIQITNFNFERKEPYHERILSITNSQLEMRSECPDLDKP
jgi:hypothetical protein